MRDNLAKFAISKNSLFEKPRLIIMSCSTKNSLCSWREWCARETFGGEAANSERASEGLFASGENNNSTRLLHILLVTCAAFCTRVRDRSSRGYPLPPATQAIQRRASNWHKLRSDICPYPRSKQSSESVVRVKL